MRELEHPNVVGIYGFYKNDPEYYYMVMDFMAGGVLFDRIAQKVRLAIIRGVSFCPMQCGIAEGATCHHTTYGVVLLYFVCLLEAGAVWVLGMRKRRV